MDDAYDTDQRLTRLEDRDRETVTQLASNTVAIKALTEKLTDGFDRIGEGLDHVAAQLYTHGAELQSLQEARGRWQSAGKWAADVVGVVVVALALFSVGVHR